MASLCNFTAIPLKKTWEVDFVKPFKTFILNTYGAGGNADDHSAALNELNELRNTVISKSGDRNEAALEAVYRYYDQLTVIEGKFPISENQIWINFKWQDAFDKESLFGGKKTLTLSSGAYEKACVLFNIAAMQSRMAEGRNYQDEEVLKGCAKLLQQASSMLNHLKLHILPGLNCTLTSDLQPDTLSALSQLMLSQAQECFVKKAVDDKMKPGIIAKLAMQCTDWYAETLKLLQLESVKPLWNKDLINDVAGKQAGNHAMAEFYQSLVAKESREFGEEIARLKHCKELILASEMRTGTRFVFRELQTNINKSLTEAEKDNNLIYHARIPELNSLTPIGRAAVAKAMPVAVPLSKQFKDLFEKIVPLSVHQSVVACENRRMVVVNSEIGRLRDATQLLNSILASLNLPAAVEDLGGHNIPSSLSTKAAEVKQMGGFEGLERLMNDLPLLLQRNKEILEESERILNEEQESDDQLRGQFQGRWNRTPSSKLTESIRADAAKYKTIISNAINADAIVRSHYTKHKEDILLLSRSDDDIQSSLPSSGLNASLAQHPAVGELRTLLKSLENVKHARDRLENEIKDASLNDMAGQFLNALLKDGAIDEEGMSNQKLESIYGSLRERVSESIREQEGLLQKIQIANSTFCEAKVQNSSEVEREEKLKNLASAYDSFTELKKNLEDGTKFYNNLTEILVRFQSKVNDFCFARKTEKEELLKDMSAGIARQSAGPCPVAPSYQKPEVADKKPEPPKRPPPPKFKASAPEPPIAAPRSSTYPSAPTSQPPPPVSYPGQTGVTPYPTSFSTMPCPSYQPPMPNSYNPYFQPQGYQQPYPPYNPSYPSQYPPQQQYPGYPPQPQQQYPGYPPQPQQQYPGHPSQQQYPGQLR